MCLKTNKHIQTWDEVQSSKHNIKDIKHPEKWLWCKDENGIFYPYSEINSHLPYYVKYCDVCGAKESYLSDGLEVCSNCGSEWNCDGELTLDVRDFHSYEEIVRKGWAVKLTV